MISRGASEFRTKPTNFGRMGAEIRLMCEQGRIQDLHIYSSETMASAQPSYDDEMYRISCRVFGPVGGSVWDKDYRLKRPVEDFDLDVSFMKRMYGAVGEHNVSPRDYVSVEMKTAVVGDVSEYVRRIYAASERHSVPAWTFLVKEEYGVYTIYIRKSFLEMFKVGKDILNYVRMLDKVREEREKARKFHKRRRI